MCATRSTIRRVFTNTSVVSWPRTSSAMRSMVSAMNSCVAIGPISNWSGTSIARSISRAWPASTISQSALPPGAKLPAPTSSRAMSSIGFCVAEMPMRVTLPSASLHSRSIVRAR